MEYIDLSVEELETIIDEILSESDLELSDNLVESILCEDEELEATEDEVEQFLSEFDKKAAQMIEKKTLDMIDKRCAGK